MILEDKQEIVVVAAVCRVAEGTAASARTGDYAIGAGGRLPWGERSPPADMRRFAELTRGQIVVMGRKTFDSLPERFRPLPDRINVVLTRAPPLRYWKRYRGRADLVFTNEDEVDSLTASLSTFHGDGHRVCRRRTCVIGGEEVFARYLPRASRVYLTLVNPEHAYVECDRFFPARAWNAAQRGFRLVDYREERNAPLRSVRFLDYYAADYVAAPLQPHAEEDPRAWGEPAYLRLGAACLGAEARPDRTGVGTRATFAKTLRFDLSDGALPLLTTRRVPWKTVLQELLWFFRGRPDVTDLERRGARIWSANASREFLDARGLREYRPGDVGPMYPFALRHYGAVYEGCDADYRQKGVDQLQRLVRGLREDPFSRRHLITFFDAAAAERCALWPCHGIAVQFFVFGVDGDGDGASETTPASTLPPKPRSLACHVYCRSSDAFLGLPFNIACYAFFAHLVAARTGTTASTLTLSLGDVHVYENHVAQMRELVTRRAAGAYPTPRVEFPRPERTHDPDFPWEDLDVADFCVRGYLHDQRPLSAPMAI